MGPGVTGVLGIKCRLLGTRVQLQWGSGPKEEMWGWRGEEASRIWGWIRMFIEKQLTPFILNLHTSLATGKLKDSKMWTISKTIFNLFWPYFFNIQHERGNQLPYSIFLRSKGSKFSKRLRCCCFRGWGWVQQSQQVPHPHPCTLLACVVTFMARRCQILSPEKQAIRTNFIPSGARGSACSIRSVEPFPNSVAMCLGLTIQPCSPQILTEGRS